MRSRTDVAEAAENGHIVDVTGDADDWQRQADDHEAPDDDPGDRTGAASSEPSDQHDGEGVAYGEDRCERDRPERSIEPPPDDRRESEQDDAEIAQIEVVQDRERQHCHAERSDANLTPYW